MAPEYKSPELEIVPLDGTDILNGSNDTPIIEDPDD